MGSNKRVVNLLILGALLGLPLAACSGDDSDHTKDQDKQSCDPDDHKSCAQGTICKPSSADMARFECVPGCWPDDAASCADGLVCEQLGTGDRHECLAPVVVSGKVFGALDGAAVSNATVVGLDPNGAARTRVARSGSDGQYELPISLQRNEDGSPMDEAITLRVAAADYQQFPLAPREALPIRLATAVSSTMDGHTLYRVQNAATDVALLPLPQEQRGGATITGVVDTDPAGGVLVLAVSDGQARSSAVTDRDGTFVLFNVKPGEITLEGYSAGVAVTPQSVTMPASGLENVKLLASSAKLATVSGNINIVNASGGLTTSVILAVASTFDAHAARGEAPAGLRIGNVSGAFQIPNVPPGRYAVLAAFENDQLVRDPDLSIAGTDIVFVDVGSDGAPVTLSTSFKVTGALAIMSPGAQGVEEVAAGMINLSWADDSSEDGYELRVYDAFGAVVHENTMIAGVSGGDKVQYALDASKFAPGMLYQFRVWSFRSKPKQTMRSYISASEDLCGVFQIER
jgi:hypothetical protein